MYVCLQTLLPHNIYRQVVSSFILACVLIIGIITLITNLSNETGHAEQFQLQALSVAHKIHYYDEVLTMSARMAAFTGNTEWNQRYLAHVVMLDNQIALAVQMYPKANDIIQHINQANQRLVAAEEQALRLSAKGQLPAAQALLFNDDYRHDKHIYQQGLSELIQQLKQEQTARQQNHRRLFILTILVFAGLLTALGFIIWQMINVLIERLDIENSIAMIARIFLTSRPDTIDQDIRQALKLITAKATADYAFFIQKRTGKHPAIVHEWGAQHDDDNIDSHHYNALISALVPLHDTAEDGQIFKPSSALINLGVNRVLGKIQRLDSRQCYQLCLLNRQNKKLKWDQRDIAVLSRITNILVRSLDAIDKTRQLQLLAERDSLTNLLNRRKYMELLEQQWQQYIRYQTPCAIMMLDIDHFKRVNDTFGHTVGDEVLASIARIMQTTIRDIDTVGRVGGEEFAILLPGVDLADGTVIAERIRHQIESTPIRSDSQRITVTVSIGITIFQAQDNSASRALTRADRALYQAKDNQRNQVVSLADSLVAATD